MRLKRQYGLLGTCLLVMLSVGSLWAQPNRSINANSLTRSSGSTDQYSFDSQGRAIKKETKKTAYNTAINLPIPLPFITGIMTVPGIGSLIHR